MSSRLEPATTAPALSPVQQHLGDSLRLTSPATAPGSASFGGSCRSADLDDGFENTDEDPTLLLPIGTQPSAPRSRRAPTTTAATASGAPPSPAREPSLSARTHSTEERQNSETVTTFAPASAPVATSTATLQTGQTSAGAHRSASPNPAAPAVTSYKLGEHHQVRRHRGKSTAFGSFSADDQSGRSFSSHNANSATETTEPVLVATTRSPAARTLRSRDDDGEPNLSTPLIPMSSQQAQPTGNAGSKKGTQGRSIPANVVDSHLLLAVVNPRSGERSASVSLQQSLRARFGDAKLYLLDEATFRDASGFRQKLRETAAAHATYWREIEGDVNGSAPSSALAGRSPTGPNPASGASGTNGASSGPGNAGDGFAPVLPVPQSHVRPGSVIVAGGDGTVAFVMSQIQEAFKMEENAASPAAAAALGHDGTDDVSDREQHSQPHSAPNQDQAFPSPTNSELPPTQQIVNGIDITHVRQPAIGVIPMGTGNDLSISLGFGGGFTERHACAACVCLPRDIDAIVTRTLGSPMKRFDRWEITLLSGVPKELAETARAQGLTDLPMPETVDDHGAERTVLFRTTFNNYVSFGYDGDIARRFDQRRRASPALHKLRTMNKAWYGWHGLCAALAAPIISKKNVAITIDSHPAPLPQDKSKAVAVLNLPSYGGGCDMWSVSAKEEKGKKIMLGTQRSATQASFSDGEVEVVTLGGMFHSGMAQAKVLNGDRVGQGREIDIAIGKEKFYIQADGEPVGREDPATKILEPFQGPMVMRLRRLAADHPTLRPVHVHVDPENARLPKE